MHYVYNRPRRAKGRDFYYPGWNDPPFQEEYDRGHDYYYNAQNGDPWPEDHFYDHRRNLNEAFFERLRARMVQIHGRRQAAQYYPEMFPEDHHRIAHGDETRAHNRNRGRMATHRKDYY